MKFTLSILLSAISLCAFSQWNDLPDVPGRVSNGKAFLQEDKIYVFGEGQSYFSDVVYVFDPESQTWSDNLTLSRSLIGQSLVQTDSGIYVIGGMYTVEGQAVVSKKIYVLKNDEWTSFEAPFPVAYAAVLYHNSKLYVVGGSDSFNSGSSYISTNRIMIYDELSKQWSFDSLSEAKTGICAISDGSKLYFAGGAITFSDYSNKIEIFDPESGQWAYDSLDDARAYIGGVYAEGKLYFAGGVLENSGLYSATDRIDIYDGANWDHASLSSPRAAVAVVEEAGRIYFIGGGTFNSQNLDVTGHSDTTDVYHIGDNSWSVVQMSTAATQRIAIGYNHRVYSFGGTHANFGASNKAYIMDATAGLNEAYSPMHLIYPNPSHDLVYFDAPIQELSLRDAQGRLVQHNLQSQVLNIEGLKPGVYFIQVYYQDGFATHRLVKE